MISTTLKKLKSQHKYESQYISAIERIKGETIKKSEISDFENSFGMQKEIDLKFIKKMEISDMLLFLFFDLKISFKRIKDIRCKIINFLSLDTKECNTEDACLFILNIKDLAYDECKKRKDEKFMEEIKSFIISDLAS